MLLRKELTTAALTTAQLRSDLWLAAHAARAAAHAGGTPGAPTGTPPGGLSCADFARRGSRRIFCGFPLSYRFAHSHWLA